MFWLSSFGAMRAPEGLSAAESSRGTLSRDLQRRSVRLLGRCHCYQSDCRDVPYGCPWRPVVHSESSALTWRYCLHGSRHGLVDDLPIRVTTCRNSEDCYWHGVGRNPNIR